ncbi:hypothetical protein PInf_010779 [Phytophthora infestans]|nr:hypothetical protein PInf_010777 [Phytophthora infestans]KAI9981161.1 hypothetical protein PInf_010779 [Phytophthora infestans]
MKNIEEDCWNGGDSGDSGDTRDTRDIKPLADTTLGSERAEREAISDNSLEATVAGAGVDTREVLVE